MANAYRDDNSVPTLIAVSNADGQTPVRIYADPVTHRLLIDSTASARTWVNETPSGTINGVNKDFTITNAPVTDSLSLFLNGQFVHPTTEYTISGTTITFVTAPDAAFSGLPFTAHYQHT